MAASRDFQEFSRNLRKILRVEGGVIGGVIWNSGDMYVYIKGGPSDMCSLTSESIFPGSDFARTRKVRTMIYRTIKLGQGKS